jgi:uncharacterized protein with von Willebrand factor type A (vWA) domain
VAEAGEDAPPEGAEPAHAGSAALVLDVPALAAGLGHALHRAGLPVTPERSSRFALALTLTNGAGTRARLYWTARAVFVSGLGQVDTFDRVFAAVFDARADPADQRGDSARQPSAAPDRRSPPPQAAEPVETPDGAAQPRSAAVSASPGGESARDAPRREVPLALAGDEERLRERSVALLEPHELAHLRRLMARLELATPRRRSRRTQRARHGERLDLRATLRSSLRTGGDPVRHARRRRRPRPRNLVLLCDISGSMEPYARAYLQLLQSAAGGGAHAEAFVFATRLTRLTRALRGRNPEAAIQRAAAAAPDWSGGTRIGPALAAFNDRFGRRGLARGAVVVILSDGWERGDPALVGREMERLARLAHRIVWVNPRVVARDFAPLAGGMAAALPHCDTLLSGHSLAALDAVADAIAAARTPSRTQGPSRTDP